MCIFLYLNPPFDWRKDGKFFHLQLFLTAAGPVRASVGSFSYVPSVLSAHAPFEGLIYFEDGLPSTSSISSFFPYWDVEPNLGNPRLTPIGKICSIFDSPL